MHFTARTGVQTREGPPEIVWELALQSCEETPNMWAKEHGCLTPCASGATTHIANMALPTMPSVFLGKTLSPTHITGEKTEALRPRAPDWSQPKLPLCLPDTNTFTKTPLCQGLYFTSPSFLHRSSYDHVRNPTVQMDPLGPRQKKRRN